MAEAIGFILAIAGLYSSCIDAFEQIRAARSFGRDFEILSTRFEVRKARFLQWGDGVGLLHEAKDGRHPQLDSLSIRPALERVLHCIQMLLTDTENLKSKYGLQEAVDEGTGKGGAVAGTTTAPDNSPTISGRRRDLFRSSYARFQSRIRKGQKESSLAVKTQWAIAGRTEFNTLISELDSMVEDLYRLVPVQPAFRKLMVKEDIDSLPEDLAILKLVQEACAVDAGAEDLGPWLEAASVRVEMTELGTQDRRDIDDWLAEVSDEGSFHDSCVGSKDASTFRSKPAAMMDGFPVLRDEYTASHVDQSTKTRPWTMEEDFILCQARKDGYNWNEIQELCFPAKTANACRKRYERLMGRQNSTTEPDTSLVTRRVWRCDGTCPAITPVGSRECCTENHAIDHLRRNHSPPNGFDWHICDGDSSCSKSADKGVLICPKVFISQADETLLDGRVLLRTVLSAQTSLTPGERLGQLRIVDFFRANADIVLIQHFRNRVSEAYSFFESLHGMTAPGQRVLYYLGTLRILVMRTECIALLEDDPCRFQSCITEIEKLRVYTKVLDAWLGFTHEKRTNYWFSHEPESRDKELEAYSLVVSEVVDAISSYSVDTLAASAGPDWPSHMSAHRPTDLRAISSNF